MLAGNHSHCGRAGVRSGGEGSNSTCRRRQASRVPRVEPWIGQRTYGEPERMTPEPEIQSEIIGMTWTLTITNVEADHSIGTPDPSRVDPTPEFPRRGWNAALLSKQ